MSNKIVPSAYRAIIDDVMLNIRSEFEEFGVEEHVLAELQSKWEAKVVASGYPPNPPPPHPQHLHHPHQPQHPALAQPPPAPRIPQVDGPASSSDGGSSSRSPSPPPPSQSQPAPRPAADTEEIGSDLDDDDSDEDDDVDGAGNSGEGAQDIVFCTYDKVQRVKNKWKCVLKDGMIHINGRDYLFAKCGGEFEW
ncbi:hypothetical protein BOTBODRAFT_149315 [Botryobasidium botryosum FD-172 SS1]|uniref:Transcription factor IIA, alpha/beta subunit n=1 Tax=Botryobasidium botryosum (strain FD-172 SS1) TaxID=930990 RepID=A0A067M6E4_BOTB1|nr:hypothetical protein BOTBODRAFT_149315 [Botryobasidium botryosum FD-172 SS1]